MARQCVIGTLGLLATLLYYGCEEETYPQGKAIYEYKCANCHMVSGEGLLGNIPPLAGSDWLVEHRSEIACVIRYGYQDSMWVNGVGYEAKMAGHPTLTDTEITNVINYVLTAWYNELEPVSPVEVKEALAACADWEKVKD